jgi:hypothetical protein
LTYNHINSPESQPVSTVNKRGSPLKLVDKVTKEVKLIWIVESLDASFGNNATTVCLRLNQLSLRLYIRFLYGVCDNEIKTYPHDQVVKSLSLGRP